MASGCCHAHTWRGFSAGASSPPLSARGRAVHAAPSPSTCARCATLPCVTLLSRPACSPVALRPFCAPHTVQLDIQATLRRVCRRVVNDEQVSKAHRRVRAEALRELGRIFREAAAAKAAADAAAAAPASQQGQQQQQQGQQQQGQQQGEEQQAPKERRRQQEGEQQRRRQDEARRHMEGAMQVGV